MKYANKHISDDELDQLFRDAHAAEGQEPLFVPEFWSEMEALLPAEKTKKRGVFWIPLAAAVLVFSIILLYPSGTGRIDKIAQSQHKHEPIADLHSKQAQWPSEDHTGQNEKVPTFDKNKQHEVRTYFHVERSNHSNGAPSDLNKPVEPEKIHPVTEEPQNAANPHEVLTEVSAAEELDAVRLEARYEQVPPGEIAALPKNRSNESDQWYVEFGPTIGQSPYLSPDNKRNIVGGAVLGGGYTKRVDNTFVSFGIQARMEGFGGLNYQETNFGAGITRQVAVKQLYSVDIPLKFGYTFSRSEFGFGVIPGIQLFLHGKETITQNQQVTRQGNFTGKVEHSNSLTMEIGLQYYYNLTPRLSLGAKVNADVLRPFHTDYYLGKSAGFPVNGQLVLRRSFSK